MKKIYSLATLGLYTIPLIASAQSVTTFVGLLNISIGILLTAASVIFLGGLTNYLFHLGSFHRDHALETMHMGVVILVITVFFVGFVHLVQTFFV